MMRAMDSNAPDFTAWIAKVEAGLRGKTWADLAWTTSDHLALPPLVRPVDVATLPHRRVDGLLRARHGFANRDLIACADPRAASSRARWALGRGADEIEFCLDSLAHDAMSPCSSDDDEDDPFATPPPGEGGVAIHTRRDLDLALDGIDLASTSLWFSAGEGAPAVLAWWLRRARAQRNAPDSLRGGTDIDPIEQLLSRRMRSARGGQIAACRTSVESVFTNAAAVVRTVRRHAPGIRPLVIDAQSFHLAGASPAVELGLFLAALVEVARGMQRNGIEFADLAAAATVRVQVGHELISEIAKLRALRLGWAKIAHAFGAEGDAWVPRLLALTSSRFRADLFDHRSNLIRSGLAASAAVIGGCDSLIVMPFDGSDDDRARDLARDQQNLLSDEAALARVTDPAGGSAAIELLTHEIGQAAWHHFQDVEQHGGFVAAAKSGLIAQLLHLAEGEREHAFRTRERVLVGISRHADLGLGGPDCTEIDFDVLDEFAESALGRFDDFCRRRDAGKAAAHVLAIKRADERQSFETTMGDGADETTLEELATARWPRAGTDFMHRYGPMAGSDGLAFEELRANADAVREGGEALPAVMLLCVGPGPIVAARADFARDLLHASGLEPTAAHAADVDAALAQLSSTDARAIVLCANDDGAADLARRIRTAVGTTAVLVWAGKPSGDVASVIDLAFHRGSDAASALQTLHERLGILLLDDGGAADDPDE